MTLNQITKVKGPGIHTLANIVSNTISLGGIATASNFKTGTSNLHNVGLEIAGINVLGADTPIGTGATIYNSGNAIYAGVVTATKFVGQVDITGGSASFSGNVSIGGTLTYEDVTNIDSVGIITARDGLKVLAGGANVVGVVTASAGIKDGTLTSGRVVYAGAGGKLSDDADLIYDGTTLSATGAVSLAGPIVLQPGGTAWSTTNNRPQIKREADGELRLGAGSDSSSIVTFYTSPSSGGTLVKRLHISANGYVGINETNPSYQLDVKGDSGISLVASSNSTAGQISIMGRNSSGQSSAISRLKSYPDGSSAQSHFAIETRNSSNAMVERLRITSGGRLGIGTEVPAALLSLPAQASGDSGIARIAIESQTDDNDFSISQYEDGNGTYTLIGQNVRLNGSGNRAVLDSSHKTAGITFDGRNHGALMFNTGGNNTSIEALRITSAGKVAIGNGSPQQLLHVWPDTANTTSAYVRVTAGDRNSNTGIDIGQDASGDGHVNVVSNGTLIFSTNNAPRIKIANNSAATSIGGAMQFNALLTTQGDVSGQLLNLKAAENTTRLMVAGSDSASCEVNLYDANGTQQVILGCSTGAGWISQTQNNYLSLKTNNTERVRILADGGTKFTRVTTGGAETVGNDPGKWFKIGTWAGSTVDAAARATITVLGAATHDSNSNVSGETKIHLAFSSNPTLYGYFYSTTAVRQGVAGVAHKYDSSAKSAEIWIKYAEGYSSTACNADVTNGFFTGENTNTGSTSTPSGATLLDSWWNIWTSDGTTSTKKLTLTTNGNFGIGGETSPQTKFHCANGATFTIHGTNAGNSYVGNTPVLTVSTDGNGNAGHNDDKALFIVGRGGAGAGASAVTSQCFRVNLGGSVQIGPAIENQADMNIGANGTRVTIKQSHNSKDDGIYIERAGERRGYYMYVGGGGSYNDALCIDTNQMGTDTEVLAIDRSNTLVKLGGSVIIDSTKNGYGGLRIYDDSSGDYNVRYIAGRNQSATAHVFMDSGRNQNASPWVNATAQESVRLTRGRGICFQGDTDSWIGSGGSDTIKIQTENKDAVYITKQQVLSTAKHETKVLQYSGLNSQHWNDNSVKRFYLNYYTGSSSATYHVARMISQTDWGFENIEVKVGKYQYSYSNIDLHTQRFRAYYGGHYNQVINYNQQAGGSGTSTEGCLQMRSNFGPGGAHQIHHASNGGYYRDCYGSDIFIQLGVYEGFRLEFTIWANAGLYDTGDYANAQAFYPAAFQGQASQSDANSWNGPRGLWVNTSSNGTGQGSNPGIFKFSTGANYGQVSST